MSEVAEVASAMLDAKMVSMFRKYPDSIDTIHFSDQFTGPKPGEDQQPLELPQVSLHHLPAVHLLVCLHNINIAICG